MPIVSKKGPVVIVTGGTFGIGRAITLELASRGFNVVAFGLESRQIGSAAEYGGENTLLECKRSGFEVDVLEADVSCESDVRKVVEFAFAKYGHIDALVNNAAIHPRGNAITTEPKTWDKVMDVNLKGPYLCVRAVIPHFLKAGGGSIVNIGSGSGWGRSNLLAYCASKGGIYALTMALAYDHMADHINVNLVIPGATQTGSTSAEYALPGFDAISRRTVTGEPVSPTDVAKAVGFLLSADAKQLTGTVLDVGCFSHQGGPPREA